MKKLLTLFLFLSLFAQAQVTNYTLSDYKYRTEGLKAIGVHVGTNFSVFSQSKNNFTAGLNPSYNFTKQYSKEDCQLVFWNNGTVSFRKSNEDSNSVFYGLSEDVNWYKRNYSDNKFIDYGSISGFGIANQNKIGSNLGFNIGLNPEVGAGIGRLEYVSNAQMALLILEDLKEAGKIKGTISNEKTGEFVNLITLLYNDRIFDYRKRRNYEVAQIENFLRTNKIVTVSDIDVYNIIADNWNWAIQPNAIEATSFYSGTLQVPYKNAITDRINQFGVYDQEQRFSGTMTRLSVNLPSNFTNSNNTYINGISNFGETTSIYDSALTKLFQKNLGIKANLNWSKHTPINLKWQRVLSGNLGFSNLTNSKNLGFNDTRPDSLIKKITNSTTVLLSAQWGYYPNSRTVVRLNTGISGAQITTIDPLNFKQKGISINANAILNCEYFINYQSRISGNVQLFANPFNQLGAGKEFSFSFFINYVNYIF